MGYEVSFTQRDDQLLAQISEFLMDNLIVEPAKECWTKIVNPM